MDGKRSVAVVYDAEIEEDLEESSSDVMVIVRAVDEPLVIVTDDGPGRIDVSCEI